MNIVQQVRQKKKHAVIGAALMLIIILAVVVRSLKSGRQGEYVYKETQVQYGTLVVGVTESGAVDIGTVEQTFDLDMSALQRVKTGNSDSGNGTGGSPNNGGASGDGSRAVSGSAGGMDMFSQIFGMGNNLTSVGSASSLTVSRAAVTVGERVREGDVLYELEEQSVSGLEQELQSNIEQAKADLDALYAEQELSRTTAEYTYKSSIAYGSYMETEYHAAIQSLQDAVDQKLLSLNRAKDSLSNYEERLTAIASEYSNACQVLANCEWSLEHTDSGEDIYGYVYYYQLTADARATVKSLEQQMEQLEKNAEQAQKNVDQLTTSYASSLRDLEQGKLSARQTYAMRQLAYDTAQETYEIALAYLEEDAAVSEEIYREAQTKWEEFSSYIDGNTVFAKYNGILTGVELSEGDSIYTGSLLVTLYDMDDITMTVTVYKDDMTDIALGSTARIRFIAYPDDVFEAEVTEISDAATDSRGNITYGVTATIRGDASGLFQGMTGEITFITEQSEDVLYVSGRAVITENGRSYVKVRDEDGSIRKVEVTTGFSDGTYIQIVEGLSEGDVVLIESRGSRS